MVVSSLQLYFVKLPSRHLAVIEEVWTDEVYRKQGLATKLIQKATQLARDKGCNCVELTVREDRPDLQQFYGKLGFEDRLNRCLRLKICK